MADILDDLRLIMLTRAGNSDLLDIASRAIAEIESLRRSMGLITDNIEPIGAVPRSSHWPAVRAAKLKAQPTCEATGSTDDLEVHHVEPFHEDPSKELDPDNLIVLNRLAHFIIGHLCSWQSWNPAVRKDAAALMKKIQTRP